MELQEAKVRPGMDLEDLPESGVVQILIILEEDQTEIELAKGQF